MLKSILRRAHRWMTPTAIAKQPQPLMCVPEWSVPMAEHHAAIWWRVKPYTMTSAERIVALCQSIAYIEKHRVPGAIVECGARKGGCMMAAALALLALDSTRRQLQMFNALEAMREVKQTMMRTRYPWEKLIFVPGRVEESLPEQAPEPIALLLLDTDSYETRYHELEHLYPRLTNGGILIVGNYGRRQGAQQAVDDYFRDEGLTAEARTIDDAWRLSIKRAPSAGTRMAA